MRIKLVPSIARLTVLPLLPLVVVISTELFSVVNEWERGHLSGAYERTLHRTALLNIRLINTTILKREESFGHMAKAGMNLSLWSPVRGLNLSEILGLRPLAWW